MKIRSKIALLFMCCSVSLVSSEYKKILLTNAQQEHIPFDQIEQLKEGIFLVSSIVAASYIQHLVDENYKLPLLELIQGTLIKKIFDGSEMIEQLQQTDLFDEIVVDDASHKIIITKNNDECD